MLKEDRSANARYTSIIGPTSNARDIPCSKKNQHKISSYRQVHRTRGIHLYFPATACDCLCEDRMFYISTMTQHATLTQNKLAAFITQNLKSFNVSIFNSIGTLIFVFLFKSCDRCEIQNRR